MKLNFESSTSELNLADNSTNSLSRKNIPLEVLELNSKKFFGYFGGSPENKVFYLENQSQLEEVFKELAKDFTTNTSSDSIGAFYHKESNICFSIKPKNTESRKDRIFRTSLLVHEQVHRKTDANNESEAYLAQARYLAKNSYEMKFSSDLSSYLLIRKNNAEIIKIPDRESINQFIENNYDNGSDKQYSVLAAKKIINQRVLRDTLLVELDKLVDCKDSVEMKSFILTTEKSGLTKQEYIKEIALACAKKNGEATSDNFKSLGLDKQEDIKEIALACAKQDGWGTAVYFKNFELTNQVDIKEIALACAKEDGWGAAEYFKNFGLTNQVDIKEVALTCTKHNGGGTANHFKNFGLTNQADIKEIALTCAKNNEGGTAEHFKNFGLTNQADIKEIALTCAENYGGGTAEHFKNFGLTNQADIKEVALTCTKHNRWGTAEHFKNFGLTNQADIKEIALACAKQDGWETARYFKNFELTSQTYIEEVLKEISNSPIGIICLYNNINLFNSEEKGLIFDLPNSNLAKILVENLNKEITLTPNGDQREEAISTKLKTQFNIELSNYNYKISLLNTDRKTELKSLISTLKITHDNFPLVLRAVSNLDFSITEFNSLRKAIPSNNAFTRIVRMLGEKSKIGGYKDLTKLLIEVNQWENLKELVNKIATEFGKSSPEQISAVLEILEGKKDELENWKKENWEEFFEDIRNYYVNIFNDLNPKIFKIYKERKADKGKLSEFTKDLVSELSKLDSGNFFGFSEEFMTKYNFEISDMLSLFGKYISIRDLNTKDYSLVASNIIKELHKRGLKQWQSEVPKELREITYSKALSVVKVYKGDLEETNKKDKNLESLLEESNFSSIYNQFLSNPIEENELKLKQAVISLVISSQNLDKNNFRINSNTAENRFESLSNWQVLLNDTFKEDAFKALLDEITKTLNSTKIVNSLSQNLDLSELKIAKKVNHNIVKAIKACKEDNIEESIKKLGEEFSKLLSRVKYESIKDETIFNSWVDSIVNDITKRYQTRLARDSFSLPKDLALKTLLRTSLLKSREVLLNKKLEAKLERAKISKLFNLEREYILSELEKYNEVITESDKNLSISFNDDLLHLMEFMTSGVCTWVSRPSQINNRDFHFGNISIKDEAGKIVSVSQVQLSPVAIKEVKKTNSNYQVIALPGLYSDSSSSLISLEMSFKLMLEFAQRKAKELGMQGAVVPLSKVIRAQSETEQKVIESFVKKGWLNKKTLESKIKLSGEEANNYEYYDVYLVEIPESEFNLEFTEQESLIASLLTNYKELKEASKFNENAYYQLRIVEELLNFEPSQEVDQKVNLTEIDQWNGFLNVFDNNTNSDYLVNLYINYLKSKSLTKKESFELAIKIAKENFKQAPCLSVLRDTIKEFLLNGVAFSSFQAIKITKFNNFDNSEKLKVLREAIETASNQNKFYSSFKSLLSLIVSNDEVLEKELRYLIENSFAESFFSKSSEQRKQKFKTYIEDLLNKYYGEEAINAMIHHLEGIRENEYIPDISLTNSTSWNLDSENNPFYSFKEISEFEEANEANHKARNSWYRLLFNIDI